MRNRSFLSFAIVLCLLFSLIPCGIYAAEQSGTCGANLVWNYDASSKRLTVSGSGNMIRYSFTFEPPWSDIKDVKTVEIKDGVTDIGGYAFCGMSSIESVSIADTVTKIGESAFSGCSGIAGIRWSSSLKEIKSNAFYNCSSLSSVSLPDSVETINYAAFGRCTGLTEFTVPKNVNYFEELVLIGSSGISQIKVAPENRYYSADSEGNLYNFDKTEFIARPLAKTEESFTLPDSVEKIGYGAFYGCSSLKTVNFSKDKVRKIDSRAFWGTGLTDVTVYAGIEYGGDVYYSCKNLANAVIEDGVSVIPSEMFANCPITDIMVPGSVKRIGAFAFSSCSSLENITIENGVEEIQDSAFQGCSSLEELVIPDSVVKIGKIIMYYAYSGAYMTSLKSITIGSGNSVYSSDNGVLYDKTQSQLIFYPTAKFGEEYALPSTVRRIENNAFAGNALIKKVIMNDGLEKIGEEAFYNCTSLAEAEIPDSVTELGRKIFNGDTAKTAAEYYRNQSNRKNGSLYNGCWLIEADLSRAELNIEPETKRIASGAFTWNYNNKIEKITIPESVERIPEGAFSSCRKMTEFAVDADNRYFCAEDGILYNKEKTVLTAYPNAKAGSEFTVPASVNTISSSAFADNKKLVKITVPGTVKTIESDAFSACEKLEELILCEGIEYLGGYVVSNSEMLKSVTVPASVTNMDESAFSLCYDLESITVAEGNTAYKGFDGALYNADMTELLAYPGCKPDTVFYIPDTVVTIADYAAYYAKNLCSVLIPESVKKIGWYAFGYCDNITEKIYTGTPGQWESVSVDVGNDTFETAKTEFSAPYTKSSASKTEGGCEVSVAAYNVPDGKKIIAAGFDRNGVLKDAKTAVSGAAAQKLILSGDSVAVKIFIWNDDMSPYAKIPETVMVK